MSRPSDNFRTNTLTVLGALGYVAFLALAGLRVLNYPVSWELIGVVLFSSSALLGVDFGLDAFSILNHPRAHDSTRDDNDRGDGKSR